METKAAAAIPTGFRPLDDALQGGLPRGRIVELFGSSSTGKTTLGLQIVAESQARGLSAAWIDADHSFDPALASQLSVQLDSLPVIQPDCAEEAIEIGRQLALSNAIDLLVLDPAAALVPRMELETSLGESSPGMQARVLSSGLRHLSAALSRADVAMLVVNQTRAGSAAETEVSAGGPGLKLHAAVRICVEASGRAGLRFRVVKNKVGAPFILGELFWATGAGFAKSP